MSEDDPTRQRPVDSGGSEAWIPAGGAPDAVTAELGQPESELSKAERKAREKAEKDAAKARAKAEKEEAKRAKKRGDETPPAEQAAEKEEARASEQAADIQEEGAREAEAAREKAEREARERRERADEEARRALEAGEAAAKRMREDAKAAEQPEPAPVVSGARLTSPGVGAESTPRAQAAASEGASAAGEPRPHDRVEPLAPGERPEVLVGAAFAGAFLFAKLLKRISGR